MREIYFIVEKRLRPATSLLFDLMRGVWRLEINASEVFMSSEHYHLADEGATRNDVCDLSSSLTVGEGGKNVSESQ